MFVVLACLLLSACSPIESLGYDYVEVTEDGTVVVGQDGWDDGIRALLESADLETWQREPAQRETEWERTTESCDPNNAQVCIELGPNSQINVSINGGTTFTTEWQVDDGGHWVPGRQGTEFFTGNPVLFEATDIAWTDDGRAVIAMSDRYPVVRNADGSFTPSIADLHPYPVISMIPIIVSWVVAVIGLLIFSRRASTKGVTAFALSSLCFLGAGVAIHLDTLGLLAAAALFSAGVIALIVALAMAFSTPPPPRSPGQADKHVSVVRLLWPFPALVALGYTWDIDLLPWLAMSALMLAVIAIATPIAWPRTANPSKGSDPFSAKGV